LTTTINVDDDLVHSAEKLTGLTDMSELVTKLLTDYVEGEKVLRGMLKLKEDIGDENPFWDDDDPRA
jgi:Arc/MetJ family transcription regulator